MIEIISMRKYHRVHDYDFRVDRSTSIGNPFPMKSESEEESNRVCDKFEDYLKELIRREVVTEYLQQMFDAYRLHGKLRLFCWCAPKRCHTETMRKHLERKIGE